MDLEALGLHHGLLAGLVRAKECGGAGVPGLGVLPRLGAEEPDIPQYLHQRLRGAGVKPAVGSAGRKVAGDQFQTQQFDVIAAKNRVLSPKCLKDTQQARILETVLCGDIPGPFPGVRIFGFPDCGTPKGNGDLRVARAFQR